jgi:hypothetical protein
MPEEKSYTRFRVEVSPSFYDLIRNRDTSYYPYSSTDHLPSKPETFKDLPGNRANMLRGIKKGDSLIFVCDPVRMSELTPEERIVREKELERKVTHVEYDGIQQTHKVFFEV